MNSRSLALGVFGITTVAALGSGCAEGPVTRFQFTTPRIVLHMHQEPVAVRMLMRTEGLKVPQYLAPTERGGGDFVFEGDGCLFVGDLEVRVERNAIVVSGVRIGSREAGYRNVTLTGTRRVMPDTFIPWEAPHH